MNNKFNLIIIFYTVSLFCSCSGNLKTADDGFFVQDFDNLKMWTRDAGVTNEQAHSGNFSAYTDSTHEYSHTFDMDLGFAKSKGYKSMTVEAWCFMTDINTDAGLVTQVDTSYKPFAYQKTDFSDFMEAVNSWQKVTVHFNLPENNPEGAKIKVYVWAPKKQKTFIDDMIIHFEK